MSEDQKKSGHSPNTFATAAVLQSTMKGLTKIFPLCHITLLVAPYSADGTRAPVNYVSTADRDDMIAVMQEFVDRQNEIPAELSKINDEPPSETQQ